MFLYTYLKFNFCIVNEIKMNKNEYTSFKKCIFLKGPKWIFLKNLQYKKKQEGVFGITNLQLQADHTIDKKYET